MTRLNALTGIGLLMTPICLPSIFAEFRRFPPISPPVFRPCVGHRKGSLFRTFSALFSTSGPAPERRKLHRSLEFARIRRLRDGIKFAA